MNRPSQVPGTGPEPRPVPEPLPPIDFLPWPPPEQPPEPGRLDQEINWRAFSHSELYEMANNGVDLEGAHEVAAQWSRLGSELADIGDELRRALDVAADGWQGAAAEQTRDTVSRLTAWTHDTADGSTRVRECVTEQAELAATAQRDMPQVQPIRYDPGIYPAGAGFHNAPVLLMDPEPDRQRAQEAHQRAAEVMERYQRRSLEVYSRVPTFTGPEEPRLLREEGDGSEEPSRRDRSGDTSTSSVGGGSVPLPGPASGGAAPGGAGLAGGSASEATPPRSGEQYAQGMRSGAATTSGGRPAGAVPGSAASRATGPAGMPMGGAGASRSREDDGEHSAPSYLEEDTDDIWGAQTPVAPPVIGERTLGHGGE